MEDKIPKELAAKLDKFQFEFKSLEELPGREAVCSSHIYYDLLIGGLNPEDMLTNGGEVVMAAAKLLERFVTGAEAAEILVED